MTRLFSSLLPTLWVIISTTLLLTACATTPPSAPGVQMPLKTRQASLARIQSWQISGKIAVRTAHDAGTATVDWEKNQNRYTISLFGPMGTNGLKLSGEPGRVVLEMADGKHYTAATPEVLLAERWGFHLPVSNMNYWIRGLPVPGIPATTHFDAFNRLVELKQENWDIQYLSFTNTQGVDLPSRIAISSPSMQVKIVIYTWKV